MLKSAQYVYDNIIIADGIHTTKEYCKPAQVGVDLSVRRLYTLGEPGTVLKSKTTAPPYLLVHKTCFTHDNCTRSGWFLPKGTYICELNEGCNFGPNDTGLIYLRSSLNRCGVSVYSAVWDPGYSSEDNEKVNPMSIRISVDNPNGFYLEENSRVAQLLVFQNEDTTQYDGQWQGGRYKSKLE